MKQHGRGARTHRLLIDEAMKLLGHGGLVTVAEVAAAAGERQTVFVTAEAGLGKTALVEAFLEHDLSSDTRVARGQCIEPYGSGEAYRPVLEALGRLCRDRGGRKVIAQLARQASPCHHAGG